jgi:hypothetical protein
MNEMSYIFQESMKYVEKACWEVDVSPKLRNISQFLMTI